MLRQKFLMLDHGGVLDGDMSSKKPTAGDLVLGEINEEGYPTEYRVLKNGILISNILKNLINTYGYKIVFHSKNNAEDQFRLLDELKKAGKEKNIEFPPIYAMAVFDTTKYPEVDSTKPIETTESGIKIAGYGKELDGKECLRNALSAMLKISEKERPDCVVFDDGEKVIKQAIKEGYAAYQISDHNTLVKALEHVLEHVRKEEAREEKAREEKNDISSLKADKPVQSNQNYTKARQKLSAACERYLEHNKKEQQNLSQGAGFQKWLDKTFNDIDEKIKKINSNVVSIGVFIRENEVRSIELIINQLRNLVLEENFENRFDAHLKTKSSEQNYQYKEEDPLSTKFLIKTELLKAQARCIIELINDPKNKDMKNLNAIKSLCHDIDRMYPILESHVKRLVVEEIRDALDQPDSKQALLTCEKQLSKGKTIQILKTNRQSASEKFLKILSVIGILAGIGIFTTAALMIKRLYKTNGTSANFFKPLTRNLHEDITVVNAKALRSAGG